MLGCRLLVVAILPVLFVAQPATDTPEAAAMRKLLATRLANVDIAEQRLEDALDHLKNVVKTFDYKLDSQGGVSRNVKVSYRGKDRTLSETLDGLLKPVGLETTIISGKNDADNGRLLIKRREGK